MRRASSFRVQVAAASAVLPGCQPSWVSVTSVPCPSCASVNVSVVLGQQDCAPAEIASFLPVIASLTVAVAT